LQSDPTRVPILLPRCAVDEQPRRLEVGGHAADLLAHELEAGQRLAELPPGGGMAERFDQRTRAHPARCRARRRTDVIEGRHPEMEATVALAEQGLVRHVAAVEAHATEGVGCGE